MIFFCLSLLCFASVVRSKIHSIDEVQSLILATINETAPNFEPCNENLLKKAIFGDMIEIKRSGYFHWCVFVNNATVIQLNNPEFDKLTISNAFQNFTGEVEMRNLIELAGKDFCRINNKICESKRKNLHILSKSNILEMMKEEIKHRHTYYNAVDYNCEHFATKLKFGITFSSQVRQYYINFGDD